MGFRQVCSATVARRKMVDAVLESPNKGPRYRVYAISRIFHCVKKISISYAGVPLVQAFFLCTFWMDHPGPFPSVHRVFFSEFVEFFQLFPKFS